MRRSAYASPLPMAALEDMLVAVAGRTQSRRARICVHESESSPIQEMFVLLMRETFKGTYRYKSASSKYLIRGEMSVQFLSDDGMLADRFSMSSICPFLHIGKMVWHTPIITSDYVLLHEIHEGPWTPDFMEHRNA